MTGETQAHGSVTGQSLREAFTAWHGIPLDGAEVWAGGDSNRDWLAAPHRDLGADAFGSWNVFGRCPAGWFLGEWCKDWSPTPRSRIVLHGDPVWSTPLPNGQPGYVCGDGHRDGQIRYWASLPQMLTDPGVWVCQHLVVLARGWRLLHALLPERYAAEWVLFALGEPELARTLTGYGVPVAP